jgi:hypothetical protein
LGAKISPISNFKGIQFKIQHPKSKEELILNSSEAIQSNFNRDKRDGWDRKTFKSFPDGFVI